MVWSMPVAEPVGILVGLVCGRIGARYGRDCAKSCEVPEWVGVVLGAVIAHYLAGAAARGVVNTAMVDPVGGAVNLAVTSPTAALLHAIYEGVTSAVPDLDGDGGLMAFLEELFKDPEVQESLAQIQTGDMATASPATGASPAGTCFDGRPHLPPQPYVPFGDPSSLISFSDLQVLNTCGLETTENMAQIAGSPVGNNLSDYVISMGGCNPQTGFPMDSYQPLLEAVGCTSLWFDANDFDTILQVVSTPGGSVGLYGDAFYLGDPLYASGGSGQLHAITLCEPWVDPATGQTIGIIGLDSNHQGHAAGYTFEELRNFVQHSTLKIPQYMGKALMCLPGPNLLAA